MKNNPRAVMKDLNWINMHRHLHLGPEKRTLLTEQLKKDVAFLMKMNIMDYSLLTGIHYLKRGNSENIRDKSLSVFEPNTDSLSRGPVSAKRTSQLYTFRKVIAESDPVALGPSSNKLPSETPSERRTCIFYQDDGGGFLATNERNEKLGELYYLGIIDILTPWNYVKKIESAWKGLRNDKKLISAVKPSLYGRRFLDFMLENVISGSTDGKGKKKQDDHQPTTSSSLKEQTTAPLQMIELNKIE